MKRIWIVVLAVIVLFLAGYGAISIFNYAHFSYLKNQCYIKTENLDTPIIVYFSSGADVSAIQELATDLKAQNGVHSAQVISADDALQSFIQQQKADGNQTVLNALNELSGNPLESTLQVDAAIGDVSSTLAYINADANNYNLSIDSVSSMEMLQEAEIQNIPSAPDTPSSTQLFEECLNSTSTAFSPASYQ